MGTPPRAWMHTTKTDLIPMRFESRPREGKYCIAHTENRNPCARGRRMANDAIGMRVGQEKNTRASRVRGVFEGIQYAAPEPAYAPCTRESTK